MNVPFQILKEQYNHIQAKDQDAAIASPPFKDFHCGFCNPILLYPPEAYKLQGYPEGSILVADKAASDFVSMSMCAALNREQIARVVTELKAIVAAPVS